MPIGMMKRIAMSLATITFATLAACTAHDRVAESDAPRSIPVGKAPARFAASLKAKGLEDQVEGWVPNASPPKTADLGGENRDGSHRDRARAAKLVARRFAAVRLSRAERAKPRSRTAFELAFGDLRARQMQCAAADGADGGGGSHDVFKISCDANAPAVR
jgi:hypothetical protein